MDRLFEYLTTLSGGSSYFIILGILVACGLGFPLPEDIPLIAAGYLSWDGTMNLGLAFAVSLVGVAIGDSLLYFFGYRLGGSILENERIQTLFKPKKIRRTKAYFRKYGDKIVFFARFVAGFRAVAFFTAGAMRMGYWRFLMLDMLAAILSVPIWIGIGYALGHYWGTEISQILEQIKHMKKGFQLVVAAIVVIVGLRIYFKYRSSKKKVEDAPPSSLN